MIIDKTKPLLSIVVPTKNRYYNLEFLVKYFHSLPYIDFELVIQDNSDLINEQKIFEAFILSINDKRIIYNHILNPISVIDNSDRAILNSHGEYICYIGDDDGFSTYLYECVCWMKNEKIDSLICNNPIYQWPDIQSKLIDTSGTISTKVFNGKFRKLLPHKELKNVLMQGATTLGKMPRLYQAIVSREMIDKIYIKTNTFFPGPSPDMANAVSLSILNPNHYYIDIPFIISGQCYTSTAGMGARHSHNGIIKNIKHLPINTDKYWNTMVPKIWTGQTIWAESALKAIEAMDPKLNRYFNFDYLYAAFFIFNPQYRRMLRGFKIRRLLFILSFLILWILRLKSAFYKILSFLKLNIWRNNKAELNSIINAIEFNDRLIDKCKSLRNINRR